MSLLIDRDLALNAPPVLLDSAGRIALTASCRDADVLPRVEGAGTIETDAETGARVQIMHNGLRVEADSYYGAWMSELIERLAGVHEPQEEVVFDSLLWRMPQQATMIEIGAYWSYYSIWFLSMHPSSRQAIGLEMDPAHLNVGRRNARLNDLDMRFFHGRKGAENAPPAEFLTESSNVQSVPTYGLSGLMDAADVERADLLLCDAQGGEIELLEGIGPVVARRGIGVLVMSTHHHMITGDPLTHQRAIAMIQEGGGRVALEHDVAESFSGDGLIVADFDGSLDGWEPPSISYCRTSKSLFRHPLFDLEEAYVRQRALEAEIVDAKAGFSEPEQPQAPAAPGPDVPGRWPALAGLRRWLQT